MPTDSSKQSASPLGGGAPPPEPVGDFAAAKAQAQNAAQAAADKTAGGIARPAAKAAAAPPSAAKAEIPAKTPAPAAPRRRGFLPLLGAAFIGGILALAGNAALSYLASSAAPAAKTDIEAVKTALSVQSAADFAKNSRLLADYQAKWQQAEQKLADKQAALEQQAAQARSSAAAPMAAASAAMAAKLDNFSQKLNSQAEQIAAHSSALAALKADLAGDAARNQQILAKTEALRGEAAQIYEKGKQAQFALARLSALQNLQAAYDSGAPYQRQLQIFRAAFAPLAAAPGRPKAAEFAALTDEFSRFADKGRPNAAALAQDFSRRADILAASADNGESETGFWQKIKNSAAKWVQIRPQGAAQGANAAAVLARIEYALNRGDYAAALAEEGHLPQQYQDKIADITAALRLQAAADRFFAAAAQALFSADGAAEQNTAAGQAK